MMVGYETTNDACTHTHMNAPAVHEEWFGVSVFMVLPDLYQELQQWAPVQRNTKVWPRCEVELLHSFCIARFLNLHGKEGEREGDVSTIPPQGTVNPSIHPFAHQVEHEWMCRRMGDAGMQWS